MVIGKKMFWINEKFNFSFIIPSTLYEITIVRTNFNKDPSSPEKPLYVPRAIDPINNREIYISNCCKANSNYEFMRFNLYSKTYKSKK